MTKSTTNPPPLDLMLDHLRLPSLPPTLPPTPPTEFSQLSLQFTIIHLFSTVERYYKCEASCTRTPYYEPYFTRTRLQRLHFKKSACLLLHRPPFKKEADHNTFLPYSVVPQNMAACPAENHSRSFCQPC